MTMPKIEPVASRMKVIARANDLAANSNFYIDGFDSHKIGNVIQAIFEEFNSQFTEAYEAGKREASEDIEQAALEKWLYDKCPSGDVESVQRQWLESYEYAELAGKMEQAAQINHLQMALADTEALEAETSARCLKQAEQIEMMREALGHALNGLLYYHHAKLVKRGIDVANEALSATPDQALEQFAAKVREQCAQMLLNGSFLHDQSPARLLAIEAAKAIRAIKELP